VKVFWNQDMLLLLLVEGVGGTAACVESWVVREDWMQVVGDGKMGDRRESGVCQM